MQQHSKSDGYRRLPVKLFWTGKSLNAFKLKLAVYRVSTKVLSLTEINPSTFHNPRANQAEYEYVLILSFHVT